MAKNMTLKKKLEDILKDEQAKLDAEKQKLVDKKKKLQDELKSIEKEIKALDKKFNKEIQQTLKSVGIPVAMAKRAGKSGRGGRGKNQTWIVDSLSSSSMTRQELLAKAETEGMNPTSIGQALYEMTKKGEVSKSGKGQSATYSA
jgi:DNA gyrase/topoisomerase IV subunit A